MCGMPLALPLFPSDAMCSCTGPGRLCVEVPPQHTVGLPSWTAHRGSFEARSEIQASGTFGCVTYAIQSDSGKAVALKSQIFEGNDYRRINVEISSLRRLSHKPLIGIQESFGLN